MHLKTIQIQPLKIQIFSLGENTEIDFPVNIEKTIVARFTSGEMLELFDGVHLSPLKRDESPKAKAIYDICHSIYTEFALHEPIEENPMQDTSVVEIDVNAKQEAPETNKNPEATMAVSQRTEAMNKLAILWVKHQQTRLSKFDNMKWFVGEYGPQLGLNCVTVDQLKDYLPKAYKAGIIDKDKKTRKFIPKQGTQLGT